MQQAPELQARAEHDVHSQHAPSQRRPEAPRAAVECDEVETSSAEAEDLGQRKVDGLSPLEYEALRAKWQRAKHHTDSRGSRHAKSKCPKELLDKIKSQPSFEGWLFNCWYHSGFDWGKISLHEKHINEKSRKTADSSNWLTDDQMKPFWPSDEHRQALQTFCKANPKLWRRNTAPALAKFDHAIQLFVDTEDKEVKSNKHKSTRGQSLKLDVDAEGAKALQDTLVSPVGEHDKQEGIFGNTAASSAADGKSFSNVNLATASAIELKQLAIDRAKLESKQKQQDPELVKRKQEEKEAKKTERASSSSIMDCTAEER